jgi:pimeloyl-ACP methyl ester carboxylesterase
VELYEQIRRDAARMRSETGAVSVRALAALHDTHRRTVRLALGSAMPPQKRSPVSRPAPVLGAFQDVIDGWLLADREAPRKQRHSARRVWQRLRDEHGCEAAETTVRDHLRARRRALGLAGEGFVPQAYVPAADAQVDWGEAQVVLAGQQTRVFLFGMRACWSGAAYWEAFPTLSQTAFLEGHARAFAWFGGVFETIRYDNLNAAVKKVLRGHRREQTDRFVALRSHYLIRNLRHRSERIGHDAPFSAPCVHKASDRTCRRRSELHNLLAAANVPGPYVLAGHSNGGLFARLYATTYPEQVRGLVLIDTGNYPAMLHALYRKMMPSQWQAYQATLRHQPPFVENPAGEQVDLATSYRQLATTQRRQPLPKMPFFVISHGIPDAPMGAEVVPGINKEIETAWQQMQIKLAHLVPGGKRIVATKSDHMIPTGQPGLVVRTIRAVLAQLAAGTRLR